MIVLEASDLQWIRGADDDPNDQCAHGRVRFEIDDVTFVRSEDGMWTLSGAALFLLRTIEHDHSPNHSVAEHNFIFPCCAHSCWSIGQGEFKLICLGCNRGIDIEIKHINRSVEIVKLDGEQKIVPLIEWRAAVFAFADQIRAFYDRSSPKTLPEPPDDKEGWAAFWEEWNRRRAGS